MYARKWVVKRVGSEGWGLQHRDQLGNIGNVPSHDPIGGDTIEQCRRYVAECSLPFDLYFEPHGALYLVLPRPELPA